MSKGNTYDISDKGNDENRGDDSNRSDDSTGDDNDRNIFVVSNNYLLFVEFVFSSSMHHTVWTNSLLIAPYIFNYCKLN